MMKNKKLLILLGVLCLINFAGHLFVYPSLPDTVPTHWGFDGQPDGWGSKSSILFLAALPFLMLLLIGALPKLDPKGSNFQRFQPVYRIFLVLLTLFMCGVSWLTEMTVFGLMPFGGESGVNLLIVGGLGLFFLIVGNYMPRIKQNYTFGCRTPWALNDEHNWERTQRMGGIVFVIMGIALLVAALFSTLLGETLTLILLVGSILGGILWIFVYSYLVYLGKMK
ncbi:MAG: SdpI family protein [Blautia massiliensis (ex Durand et al. 2017)]